MYVLGLSCYYHDSAACLLRDGEVVAAAEEERFSRVKHDSSFPDSAVEFCLDEAGISAEDLDYVGFYEKPIEKFDRILETYLSICPSGYRSFVRALPLWIRKRLWIRSDIKNRLNFDGEVLFGGHHESHAASSFYASPFQEAAILTVDGVGEWNTTSYGVGKGNQIDIRKTIDFPHSIGLLYSAFTYYLGFQVNNGEYKVMGLSSYGSPEYKDVIEERLIDQKEDGSFRLNMEFFDYLSSLEMIREKKFEDLFGKPRRQPDSDLEGFHFDVAASIQRVTEDAMLKMAEEVHEMTGMDYLCMGGGVALNSVCNGKLLEESPFEDIFIQPAAGDDGAAYGVAASIYYEGLGVERTAPENRTSVMKSGYLGPGYDEDTIREAVRDADVEAIKFSNGDDLLDKTATLLSQGNVVGWYQGRMEWGPRALGNRSILADPREEEMQDTVNRKIKFREGFRPFAPTVLADYADEYFRVSRESPYMLFVHDVLEGKGEEIPAVTHVDGTSRVQTLRKEDNPTYYGLIDRFREKTGTPVLLNTSFNRRGEPIVNTPRNAVECFMETNMDLLSFPEANLLVREK